MMASGLKAKESEDVAHDDKTLYVIVNTSCNLKCPYCYYVRDPTSHRPATLKVQDLGRLGVLLRSQSFRQVILTGGEPTLNRHLQDYIVKMKDLGFSVGMVTNGTLIDGRMSAILRNSGLDYAFVSIDDVDCNVLNEIRGAYSNIMRGLENLKMQGIPVTVNVVVSGLNVRNLFSIYTYFESQGIPVSFHPIYLDERTRAHSPYRLDPLDSITIAEQLGAWANTHKTNNYLRLLTSQVGCEARVKPAKCMMSESVMIVDANGDIYPCFYRQDLRLGNVADEDYQPILRAAELAYEGIREARCFGMHCVPLFSKPDAMLALSENGMRSESQDLVEKQAL